MLYEFAITPDAFDTDPLEREPALQVILIELLRGLEMNGMVANLHAGEWVRHVQRVRLANASIRDKVLAHLEHLDNLGRLVEHPPRSDQPTCDKDWVDLIRKTHARKQFQFHEVVLGHVSATLPNVDDPAFVQLPQVLDSAPWLQRRTSRALRMHEGDYRAALAPLLRHARWVYLIDPHLSWKEKRFSRTIEICAELLGRRGHNPVRGKIHIHVEGKDAEPEFNRRQLDDWTAWLEKLIRSKRIVHSFHVNLWAKHPFGENLHDRFLITNQCCVSAPGGLDCWEVKSDVRSTNWSLLSHEESLQIQARFDPATKHYHLLERPREVRLDPDGVDVRVQ